MKYIRLFEELDSAELAALEDYADYLFSNLGVDIVFSRHFKERINDARNGRPITYDEVTELFRKARASAGREIAELPPHASAVLTDLVTKINAPFVMQRDARHREKDLVMKTIMRKSHFMSSDPHINL
jgi:hypothetical protein